MAVVRDAHDRVGVLVRKTVDGLDLLLDEQRLRRDRR